MFIEISGHKGGFCFCCLDFYCCLFVLQCYLKKLLHLTYTGKHEGSEKNSICSPKIKVVLSYRNKANKWR